MRKMLGSALSRLLNRGVRAVNTDHASTKIRTVKGITMFSAGAHVPKRGVSCTLGRHLPRSVHVRLSRRMRPSFRPHCYSDRGACRCHVLGHGFPIPARHLCACFCRCGLSMSGVGTTASCLVKRRSFTSFYNTGTRMGAAVHAIAKVSM